MPALVVPGATTPFGTSGAPARTSCARAAAHDDASLSKRAASIIDFADGAPGHPPDCDPGTNKEIDVQELAKQQTVTLTDSSVTPAKVTPVMIPPVSSTPATTGMFSCTGTVALPPGAPSGTVIPTSNAVCNLVLQ